MSRTNDGSQSISLSVFLLPLVAKSVNERHTHTHAHAHACVWVRQRNCIVGRNGKKITQIFFYFWRELHTHTRARKGIGMRVFYRKRKLISKSTAAGTIGSFMEQCERQTKKERQRESARHRRVFHTWRCRSPISKMLLNKLVETNSNWKLNDSFQF